MSRLAALQGHAVPTHRFGMVDTTPEGVSVLMLSRAQRAEAWWQSRFAQSDVRRLAITKLTRNDLPALWCAEDRVLLLRGEATLTVAGRPVHLRSGDHLFLPAGTHHVVQHTTDGALWLAIHLHPQQP